MTAINKSRKELLAENEDLRRRLEEAEVVLAAIRSGEVDAVVVSRPEGDQVFTLQGAESPYRMLVEAMNEGAANLTLDGVILYCNRRLAAMLQLPMEKLIGTQLGSYVSAKDYAVFTEHLANYTHECGKEEISLINGTGDRLPVLFSCCSVELSGSAGVGVVLTDISNLKKAEAKVREAELQIRMAGERARVSAQLQAANEELQAANEELLSQKAELQAKDAELTARSIKLEEAYCELEATMSRQEVTNRQLEEANSRLESLNQELEAFSHTVSHDLRSPLNNISVCAQALEMVLGERLDAKSRGLILDLGNEVEHMNLLITLLLRFSRAGRHELKKVTVDLSGLVCEVVKRLRMKQPDRSVECNIAENIAADGDEQLIQVVMENLLGNAWKYTGKRERGCIDFGRTEADGKPVYFVRDNGAGFDMALAGDIFKPFKRLHGEEFEGHGIGLATVKRIINRHGGRIWAEGNVGKGATFYFTLG